MDGDLFRDARDLLARLQTHMEARKAQLEEALTEARC
jgi:hypothetical protein